MVFGVFGGWGGGLRGGERRGGERSVWGGFGMWVGSVIWRSEGI